MTHSQARLFTEAHRHVTAQEASMLRERLAAAEEEIDAMARAEHTPDQAPHFCGPAANGSAPARRSASPTATPTASLRNPQPYIRVILSCGAFN